MIETAYHSTTHRYGLQVLVDGVWMLRPMTFSSLDGAELAADDVYGVDDPAVRVVRITTIVTPVDAKLSFDMCVCGHRRESHGSTYPQACIAEVLPEEDAETGAVLGGFADDCLKFERKS